MHADADQSWPTVAKTVATPASGTIPERKLKHTIKVFSNTTNEDAMSLHTTLEEF